MSAIDFSIEFDEFNIGMSPTAHLDDKTFVGSRGHASDMKADIISNPGFMTQSPGLADLTNGTQDGVVNQLIRHILDQPTAVEVTYGIGTTKLFKITPTTVTSGGGWPQTIASMVEGESVIRLKANLYGFYNKVSGGDIFQMPLATEVVTPTWGSSNHTTLENAPHPSAAKEDIMVFGNGRYLGVYVEGSSDLNVQKLDFGEGSEVVDVVFHSNMWWIAVNYGEGKRAQIYLYDGSAISNILSDEAGLGDQEIGFLYVYNGNIFVAYQDKSSAGFIIGWLQGRSIKPLRYFSGALPNHRQKTLYKNTVLFASSGDVWSCGASVEQLPIQISKLTNAGHATVGAIAAPFGIPMVASTDEGSNYRLAKFSGFATDSHWKSAFVDVTRNRDLGKIADVIVLTKPLATNARCDITIQGNQEAVTSNTLKVTTVNKTRHVFRSIDLKALEDLRVVADWTNGNTTNDCPIRKIIVTGNFVER